MKLTVKFASSIHLHHVYLDALKFRY